MLISCALVLNARGKTVNLPMLYPNEIGFEPAQEVLGTDHLPRVAQNCRRWNLQVLEVLTPEEVATCYNLQPYPIPFYIHLHTHNTPRVIKHRDRKLEPT